MNDLGNYLVTFFLLAAFIGGGAIALRGTISTISRLRSSEDSVRTETRRKVKTAVMACGAVVILTYGASRVYTEADLRVGDAGRFATQSGSLIHLHPSDITFRIPQGWIEWNGQFHNNIHLSHRELRSVRLGYGEWDTEYGDVVNSALPFEDCAAHVGGDGWGREGSSFADLQVRAYVTNLTTAEVANRIKNKSFKSAKEISSNPEISAAKDRGWERERIRYLLLYGDYGGTANIDFYFKDVGKYRLVLVFMGWNEEERNEILDSVQIPT